MENEKVTKLSYIIIFVVQNCIEYLIILDMFVFTVWCFKIQKVTKHQKIERVTVFWTAFLDTPWTIDLLDTSTWTDFDTHFSHVR